MLPDSTCATLRSTHDGRFGRGVSASPETLSRPEAGISDACPRPCDAMPDAPETPEVPEVPGTHPSAAAASCHSSDTLCLLFSLIAGGGIRRQKYTIFRYESPPCGTFPELFLSTRPRLPATASGTPQLAHRGRQHSNTPYGLKNHCFCLPCRFFNYLCYYRH